MQIHSHIQEVLEEKNQSVANIPDKPSGQLGTTVRKLTERKCKAWCDLVKKLLKKVFYYIKNDL